MTSPKSTIAGTWISVFKSTSESGHADLVLGLGAGGFGLAVEEASTIEELRRRGTAGKTDCDHHRREGGAEG
jgi:hypothetical protein